MTGVSKTKADGTTETLDVCAFCLTRIEDELNLGKFYTKGNINVHYFCMLLSSGLLQNGGDDEGIFGFLLKDIEREIRRGQKLRCSYCKQHGATIGCAEKSCTKKFHLPCGLAQRSLHRFTDSHHSYCEKHKPVQRKTAWDQRIFLTANNNVCAICLLSIEKLCTHTTLRAPCCKNAWFHRQCLQMQAVNAGYFFRCPLCNNNKEFKVEMLNYGIYVPEQDASWEKEQGAFQDLLYRHNKCDVQCSCPNGSEFNEDGSLWEIILCKSCGSQGCHVTCGKIDWIKRDWECKNCLDVRRPVVMQEKAKEIVATAGVERPMDPFVKIKLKRTDCFSSDDSNSDSDIEFITIDDNNSAPMLPNKCGSSNTKQKQILQSPQMKQKQCKDKMAETTKNWLDVQRPVVMQEKLKEMVTTAGVKRKRPMSTFVTVKWKRTDCFSDDSDSDSDIEFITPDDYNSPPMLPSKTKQKQILQLPKLKLKQCEDKMAETTKKLFTINEAKFVYDKHARTSEPFRLPPQIEVVKSYENMVPNSAKNIHEFGKSWSSVDSGGNRRFEVPSNRLHYSANCLYNTFKI